MNTLPGGARSGSRAISWVHAVSVAVRASRQSDRAGKPRGLREEHPEGDGGLVLRPAGQQRAGRSVEREEPVPHQREDDQGAQQLRRGGDGNRIGRGVTAVGALEDDGVVSLDAKDPAAQGGERLGQERVDLPEGGGRAARGGGGTRPGVGRGRARGGRGRSRLPDAPAPSRIRAPGRRGLWRVPSPGRELSAPGDRRTCGAVPGR